MIAASLGFGSAASRPPFLKRLQARRSSAEQSKQIQALEKETDRLSAVERSAQAALAAASVERQEAERRLVQLQSQCAELEQQAEALESERRKLEKAGTKLRKSAERANPALTSCAIPVRSHATLSLPVPVPSQLLRRVTPLTRGSPKRSPASIGIVEPLSADSAATIAELAAELEQKDAAVLDLQMQVQQLQGRLENTSSNIMVELEEAKSAKKRAEKIGQKVSAELEQLQEELAVLQSERDRLKQARYSLRGTNAAGSNASARPPRPLALSVASSSPAVTGG